LTMETNHYGEPKRRELELRQSEKKEAEKSSKKRKNNNVAWGREKQVFRTVRDKLGGLGQSLLSSLRGKWGAAGWRLWSCAKSLTVSQGEEDGGPFW